MTDQQKTNREALTELIAEHLSGTYHCTRVWSAWNVGTMSQDDFEDVGDSDTPTELADAILASPIFLAADPTPVSNVSGTSQPVSLGYTNWRGEFAERSITPIRVHFGATDWHPEPQWLLEAFDHDRGANRDFALKDFGDPGTPPSANPGLVAERECFGIMNPHGGLWTTNTFDSENVAENHLARFWQSVRSADLKGYRVVRVIAKVTYAGEIDRAALSAAATEGK